MALLATAKNISKAKAQRLNRLGWHIYARTVDMDWEDVLPFAHTVLDPKMTTEDFEARLARVFEYAQDLEIVYEAKLIG